MSVNTWNNPLIPSTAHLDRVNHTVPPYFLTANSFQSIALREVLLKIVFLSLFTRRHGTVLTLSRLKLYL
jgi:hypothetical protein